MRLFHLKLKIVKKAYYRLSLQVHPDRVSEDEKAEATEKFKVLTKINNVLTDPNKKAIYDEQGIIDDEGESESNWMQMWQQFFKPITVSDIERFKSEYIGVCLVIFFVSIRILMKIIIFFGLLL